MVKFAKLMVASGENSADMRYAAGFSTPDEFLWYECENHAAVVCSPLEYNRALRQRREGVEVFPESEFDGPDRVTMIGKIAAKLQVDGFLVPADFPLGLADRVRQTGVKISAAERVFFPERQYKTPDEVDKVICSQRAGEAGCRRAFEILRESEISSDRMIFWQGKVLTSEILRAEIDGTMLRLGMIPTGTICAGGRQSSQPHNTGSGPLAADHPIVMDIFPRSASTGYWGDLTRTVVKGRASDLVKKAYDAVLAARELGKSLVRTGADSREIHLAAAALMERAGFHTGRGEKGDFGFFHGLGHGVGLDIHEPPRLSPRSRTVLQGNEIVTVEPGLYYPEWGGIRLEDLMLVRPERSRCLTEIEDFLEIP